MEEIINRHERIALQFSGGKDSLACLYLMRPYWGRLTVYWLNTGDAYPETVQLAAAVKDLVPSFVEVAGRQPKVIEEFGYPSDIVPVSSTPIGIISTGRGVLLQDRYSCCFRSLMMPMHQRMLDDGITLIVRGQRADDAHKAPVCSGTIDGGIEYLFPIEGWDKATVMRFLNDNTVAIPRFYEVLDEAPDCMGCSAWWEKGEARYLKRYHGKQFIERQRRMDIINSAVSEHIANFNKEVSA